MAANNNKLAVLPDETNREYLHPNQLDHSSSNSLTLGPFVNLSAWKPAKGELGGPRGGTKEDLEG